MIYFISDLHLGDKKVFKDCKRDKRYPNIYAMHSVLIANINRFVREGDTLYILGDVGKECSAKYVTKILSALNCEQLHLIVGNHDDKNLNDDGFCALFKTIKQDCLLKYNDIEFYLSHMPDETLESDSIIQVYGHYHYPRHKYEPVLLNKFGGFNVSVEYNCFLPVSAERIYKKTMEKIFSSEATLNCENKYAGDLNNGVAAVTESQNYATMAMYKDTIDFQRKLNTQVRIGSYGNNLSITTKVNPNYARDISDR